MKEIIIWQSGITVDGKRVVSGCFEARDTYGLPLDIIVQDLRDKKAVINWEDYVNGAIKAGWSLRKIRGDLTEVLPDSCEPSIVELILRCWKKYVESEEKETSQTP